MILAHPEYLWFMLLIPFCIAIYVYYDIKRHACIRVSSIQFLRLPKDYWHWLRHIPITLTMVGLGFLIFATSRPQNTENWDVNSIEGIDLILALDASTSMLAEDLKPNRFEAAKKVASEMISNRPNDNIGLVIFSGESFTQCPVTTDHVTLMNLLNEAQVGMLKDGTAIGLGLATSINAVKTSKSKSKVVILLTDGSNNTGYVTPLMASDMAKNFGVRAYTVGVGSEGEAPYPVQTAFGIQYVQMKVDLDETTLKKISENTNGQYYRATDNESLNQIYHEIDQLEKSKLMSRNYRAYEELYRPYALIALILLMLAILLRSTFFRTNP